MPIPKHARRLIALFILLSVSGCLADPSVDRDDTGLEMDATAPDSSSRDAEAPPERGRLLDGAVDAPPPPVPEGRLPSFELLSEHPTIPCMNTSFSTFVDVFGVFVVATEGAPSDYVIHTAHVLAQYLDNDEDGVPDDAAVHAALIAGNYVVPVWQAAQRDAFHEGARGTYCEDNTGMAASMYYDEDEWALGGIEQAGTWDTNLEEVWHVVTVGWAKAYPEAFGADLDDQGQVIRSRLTDAMDAARGGQFIETPARYPDDAWYTYDDASCGYPCQAHEYVYWILMANMGALDPAWTDKCEGSRAEWFVCDRDALQARDPLAFDLLNTQGFKVPTRTPDGSYRQ